MPTQFHHLHPSIPFFSTPQRSTLGPIRPAVPHTLPIVQAHTNTVQREPESGDLLASEDKVSTPTVLSAFPFHSRSWLLSAQQHLCVPRHILGDTISTFNLFLHRVASTSVNADSTDSTHVLLEIFLRYVRHTDCPVLMMLYIPAPIPCDGLSTVALLCTFPLAFGIRSVPSKASNWAFHNTSAFRPLASPWIWLRHEFRGYVLR